MEQRYNGYNNIVSKKVYYKSTENMSTIINKIEHYL